MRHAEVRYFEGVHPEHVVLTENGMRQADAAAAALSGIAFDRVFTSGLERTLETARIVAPGREPESRYALREIESGDIRELSPDEVQAMMTAAFRGVVPLDSRFLGGETIGELFDRVLPALESLFADRSWDSALVVLHGAVNRAILSYALVGERMFLGHFEQAPGCVNLVDVGDDWPATAIVRAVNLAPLDLLHASTRLTTMEGYWAELEPYLHLIQND